jgi:hypothetical protein
MKRPGEDVTVVAGDSDFAPGGVRFSFLVINHDARPWTFVVGRDGRIEAKFEGSVSAAELEAAIRRLLL